MRIDSSNIGMESERSYSATSTRVTKMTITNSRQKLEDGTDSLFGNLLGTGEEETSMSREEVPDADKEESPEDFLSKTIEEMRAKINAFRMGKIENMDAEKCYLEGRFDAVPYINSSISVIKNLLGE